MRDEHNASGADQQSLWTQPDDFVKRIAAKTRERFALTRTTERARPNQMELVAENTKREAPLAPAPAFKDAKSDSAEIHSHPTAIELVAGIAKAGREGRIKAWRANSRERDFEPALQPDGNWLTCCPAHDDHNPSFIASDVDENGKPKVLIYCRSGCSQDTLIKALDELSLWNCAPGTI